tara:strand:+ start:916 stop:1353 length:438 start_codon:yes stop_codon:yes gene_type:complete
MKFNVLFFILFSISIYSQNNNNEFYGEKFDYDLEKIDNSIVLADLKIRMKGEIISTCPMKGCWMNMNIANDTILVRFKDYGFFVPKTGVEGNTAIINGYLSIDTLSVAQLRHYAEDAGKNKNEIMKITNPKTTLSFLADGVAIQE